jgi:hypothetical protein
MLRLWFLAVALCAARLAHCALLAHYAFDNNYQDSSGNGHHGTAAGAGIGFAADPERGTVLDISGALEQYVEVADNAGFAFGAGFALSAFVKLTAFPANGWGGSVVSKEQNNAGFNLRTRTNQPNFQFVDTATNYYDLTIGGTPITLNKWHHMLGNYDKASGVMNFYFDGVLAGTLATTGTVEKVFCFFFFFFF